MGRWWLCWRLLKDWMRIHFFFYFFRGGAEKGDKNLLSFAWWQAQYYHNSHAIRKKLFLPYANNKGADLSFKLIFVAKQTILRRTWSQTSKGKFSEYLTHIIHVNSQRLNPSMPSGLFFLNTFDQSISSLRDVWSVLIIIMFYWNVCS